MGQMQHTEKSAAFYTVCVFFPQLIQGPISRYGDLSQTLYAKHSFDGKQVRFSLERILWGYFKKLVIADRLSGAISMLMGDPEYYTGLMCLSGCYFMQHSCMRTLRVVLILRSVLHNFLAYMWKRTLSVPSFQRILRNIGADGISRWERGSVIMFFIR